MAIGIKATDDADGYNWPANFNPHQRWFLAPQPDLRTQKYGKRIKTTRSNQDILFPEEVGMAGIADRLRQHSLSVGKTV